MPTLVKTPCGSWKALSRKNGFPTTIKTFRLKRDAEDWARRTEDESCNQRPPVDADAETLWLADERVIDMASRGLPGRKMVEDARVLIAQCATPR